MQNENHIYVSRETYIWFLNINNYFNYKEQFLYAEQHELIYESEWNSALDSNILLITNRIDFIRTCQYIIPYIKYSAKNKMISVNYTCF